MRPLVLLVAAACTGSPAPVELESSPVEPAAPTPAPPPSRDEAPVAACGDFPADADLQNGAPGTPIAIDALIASRPTSGRFTVEGYLQSPHVCAPCPAGATCEPCEASVWLSPVKGAYKGLMSLDHDLNIRVPDAGKFEILGRYAMTVVLCARHQSGRPLHDLAIRGYRRLPD